MGCGREPGGEQVTELGTCPATTDTSFNGLNSGINAGRICWAVAGTFCGGRVQGTFAEKRGSCISCNFFEKVQKEEGNENRDTKFLRYVTEHTNTGLLQSLTYRHIRAGERFITQGEVTDTAYIIQRGSCLAIVEKKGELHPVGHFGEGDIVGELAILTGEPQNTHVEAQTDMALWCLNRAQFEDISKENPELLDFLTELVTDRFDSRRPTADRAIGKYVAKDIIGRGAYSIVYKGVHAGLDMPVVIKMMRHHLAMNPEFLRSFRNEAKIIAGLNHENIIKVYDIEEVFRTVFIIMEALEGETVDRRLKRLTRIPPPLAADFLVQTCNGLAYAHQKGILHQDINPSNLFVQSDAKIKILDFGLACPPGTEDRSIFDGTIHYMAPEQIRCAPVDRRTDIYSLGITAFEMITGTKPFQGKHVKDIMDQHLYRGVPDPLEIVPGLPDALRRFIMKACHRNPNQRYQNIGQALKDLLPLIESGSAGYAAPDPIKILIHEHALIRQFLDILTIAADKLGKEEPMPKEFFEKAVKFARSFTDKFHHFKEEHVMFTQLAQKKEGELDAQIGSLRYQHERGRNFISEISNAIDRYPIGNEILATILLENLSAYIALLRLHIHKEDHIFFPMVENEFSVSDLRSLLELFEEENHKTGGKTLEESQKLVQEMAELL